MGLDFEPESKGEMRDRYPDAIEEIYDYKNISDWIVSSRPGANRKHVFDFFDGCRVVASRERYRNGVLVLHFSISLGADQKAVSKTPDDDVDIAVAHVQDIRGEEFEGAVSFMITRERVIHLMYAENPANRPQGMPSGEYMGNFKKCKNPALN